MNIVAPLAILNHFSWPRSQFWIGFCETRPPVNVVSCPLVLGFCCERAGKDSVTAGLEPLSSGWRPLGSGMGKILEIRFATLRWMPEVCSEEEKAPWLELLSFGGGRYEHDPMHHVRGFYRQVPSLKTGRHNWLDMTTGAARHAEG